MSTRFTIDGSDAQEQRLTELCEQVSEEVLRRIPSARLHALVLGGGYGRGEGGVLSTERGHEPYNDLEFYLIARGPELATLRHREVVAHLAEELTARAGIEVELKLLSLRKLERSPVTMFYYDLVSGHRSIHGADAWLSRCEHHRAAHRIPLYEATRLLMNRCSGLLFSQERLNRKEWTEDDADFVGRNLAKAKLALGDVLLTTRGLYHWSCQERHKRLKKLAAEKPSEYLASLLILHEQGVNFKLHPVKTTRSAGDLRSELAFVKELARDLWLQLESRRLGRSFGSTEEYCLAQDNKCPETRSWKNRLINARSWGVASVRDATYPRERILRSLPILLWHQPSPEWSALTCSTLRAPGTDRGRLLEAYSTLWKSFN
jgi:hypothetical protein